MKCSLFVLGSFLASIPIVSQLDGGNPQATDKKEPEKTDITAQVREMNSDKYAPPPTEFRAGHVTLKALPADALKKTDNGFTIKLPSGAPIPTPTVYKGKLFVSGGFSTKEYFCFDAVTGKMKWGVSLDDDTTAPAASPSCPRSPSRPRRNAPAR